MSAIYEEVLSLFEETNRQTKETDRRFRELERITREQCRQIGGLGDKFGYFTEGMALPSMERILTERFGMTTVMPRVRTRKNGENIDLLGCPQEGWAGHLVPAADRTNFSHDSEYPISLRNGSSYHRLFGGVEPTHRSGFRLHRKS